MPKEVETLRFGDWFVEYVEEGDVKVMLALFYGPEQSKATARELDLLRQVCISFGFTESDWVENLA